jgi:hypothetical protein
MWSTTAFVACVFSCVPLFHFHILREGSRLADLQQSGLFHLFAQAVSYDFFTRGLGRTDGTYRGQYWLRPCILLACIYRGPHLFSIGTHRRTHPLLAGTYRCPYLFLADTYFASSLLGWPLLSLSRELLWPRYWLALITFLGLSTLAFMPHCKRSNRSIISCYMGSIYNLEILLLTSVSLEITMLRILVANRFIRHCSVFVASNYYWSFYSSSLLYIFAFSSSASSSSHTEEVSSSI